MNIDETTLDEKLKKHLKMSFTEAQREYYWVPSLESLIEKGLTAPQIAERLKTHRGTVFRQIRRIWDLTFEEARNKYFWAPTLFTLIKKGWTQIDIAEKTGTSRMTVRTKVIKIFNTKYNAVAKIFKDYESLEDFVLDRGINIESFK